MYRSSPVFKELYDPERLMGKCGRCTFRVVCGGCRSRAYVYPGDDLGTERSCAFDPDSWKLGELVGVGATYADLRLRNNREEDIMAGRTVVVLGGGVGGVVAARKLRQKLGTEHRVVLVDKEDRHYFPPSFPWVMVARREPQSTYRQLSGLSRRGIEFVQGEVTAIDVNRHEVATSSGDLSWDYLVIALGTEMTYDNVPGLKDASHTYYSLEGAVGLRSALDGFTGGKVLVTVAGTPYRCPAAPYEGTLLIDHYLRNRGKRDSAEIKFFTLEPAPMPVAGPEIGGAVEELLARRDVSFGPNKVLASIEGVDRVAVFADGTREGFDLLVTIPQHQAPAVLAESGLVGESGWVEVDRETLATSSLDVYALGDATYIRLVSGLPLPKAGVFAHAQANVIAENVAYEVLHGRGGEARFDGHGS